MSYRSSSMMAIIQKKIHLNWKSISDNFQLDLLLISIHLNAMKMVMMMTTTSLHNSTMTVRWWVLPLQILLWPWRRRHWMKKANARTALSELHRKRIKNARRSPSWPMHISPNQKQNYRRRMNAFFLQKIMCKQEGRQQRGERYACVSKRDEKTQRKWMKTSNENVE